MKKLLKIIQSIGIFCRKLLKYIFFTLVIFLLLSVLLVFSMRWINPITSTLIIERKIESWQSGHPINILRQWEGGQQIADDLKLAVIASEDQNFPFHHGFDMEAIEKALKHNAEGGTLRGASTISQQVAKNIFLWSDRSWFRKGLEVWFTAWIEVLWSKERILEIYLNSVEWGNGIFGAEAAAQYYFHIHASELTKQQASLMAAVLPNPRVWTPSYPSIYIKKRSFWIQKQMSNLGGDAFLLKLKCARDCD